MRKFLQSDLISTGLAIFSMLFGAGNLMYPLKVGLMVGAQNLWAISGFLLTSVCLPLMGLVALILFDGDYERFFKRLGDIPGALIIFLCMLIIGPFFVMPRIVTLSHIMIAPYMGNIPLWFFSIIFCFFTFLGCYKEQGIIKFLGSIVSPALLVSLFIIIIKGIFFTVGTCVTTTTTAPLSLFWESFQEGYKTLDLLGTIFFSAIVITILKKNMVDYDDEQSLHSLALIGFKAGTIGVALLALVYIAMSYIAILHGCGLEHINHGELFNSISLRILGSKGSIVIAVAVLMACYSTVIALAAVLAEYLNKTIFRGKVCYTSSLILVLVATTLMSNIGLTKILEFSAPIIDIGYPAIIMITICNILYKVCGFKAVKFPVLITLIISFILYFV